jgi:hypothetical protein
MLLTGPSPPTPLAGFLIFHVVLLNLTVYGPYEQQWANDAVDVIFWRPGVLRFQQTSCAGALLRLE